jgi:hypothetical protein
MAKFTDCNIRKMTIAAQLSKPKAYRGLHMVISQQGQKYGKMEIVN